MRMNKDVIPSRNLTGIQPRMNIEDAFLVFDPQQPAEPSEDYLKTGKCICDRFKCKNPTGLF